MKFKLANIFLALFLMSCGSDMPRSMEPRSTAFGKLNEIVVIADDDLWESEIGDTFKYYFESAYPIMPQPEPYFDLRQFNTPELREEPMRKELRTYAILANLSDSDSPTTQMVKKDLGSEKFNSILNDAATGTSVGRDKWAKGQMLVYLVGSDHHKLIDNIRKSFPAVSKKVNQHDQNILESSIYAVELENKGLINKINQQFGVELKIPGGFQEALDLPEEDFMWIRRDDDGVTQSFLIKKMPYTSAKQLELENLIKLRNQFGNYISTDTENSTMVVNDEDLPVYEYPAQLDGQYAKEIRGVWEMTNDFLGGAFSMYAMINETTQELIVIDAFVFAPGKEKRDVIQKMDFIVKNLKVTKAVPKGEIE